MNHADKIISDFQAVPSNIALVDSISDRIRLLMKLRNCGIQDSAVLSAIESVPRELFAPDIFREHAYDDTALPIAFGQTISQPTIVAKMTVALNVLPRMRVLEVGTGSGYQAAILAKLARRVYTIERHRELLAVAEQRFVQLKIHNIITKRADGSKGWKEVAPFERIIVTAAAQEIPGKLVDQLSDGGVMIIPVGGSASVQNLLKISKDENGKCLTQSLMDVRFVPLIVDK